MSQSPTFKNQPNILHKIDGKEIWEARYVAIEAIIFAIYNDSIYVLVEKRSSIMDEAGKWCLPCGYIDWSESGWDAAVRETFEETSLYIPKYDYFLVTDNDKKPFEVITDPDNYKQHIVLEYCVIFDFGSYEKRFPIEIMDHKNKEVTEIKWMFIEDVFKSEYVWAFEHDTHIENAVNHFKKFLI